MSFINNSGLQGKDDFLGFTFNGKHSSDFHIVRVSTGSRYETNLMPTSKQNTIDIPSIDGLLYVNNKYQQKEISLDFAFDYLLEENLEAIKNWLCIDSPKELWFDETPYKKYYAKPQGTPRLSWIAFNENGKRIYKGEGNISFICYDPWAHSRYKTLDEYRDEKNLEEWKIASNMKQNFDLGNGQFYDYVAESSTQIKVFNAGHLATPFKMAFKVLNSGIQKIEYSLGEAYETENVKGKMYIDTSLLSTAEDSFYLIDTKMHTLSGIIEPKINGTYIQTGNIYNYAVVGGDFFNIYPGEGIINLDPKNSNHIQVLPVAKNNIVYDYLYR